MSKLAQKKLKITITNLKTNQPPPPMQTRVEAKSKVTVPYNSGMYPLYAPSPVHTKLYGSVYTPVLNFLQGGGREKNASCSSSSSSSSSSSRRTGAVGVVGKTNGYRRGTALLALLSMQEN